MIGSEDHGMRQGRASLRAMPIVIIPSQKGCIKEEGNYGAMVMATEGFDAAKAAVDQMKLNDSLKGAQQLTTGASPLANLSSAIQTATGLVDVDYWERQKTNGLLQDVQGPLFTKRKGMLGSMFDGIVTFEWDKDAAVAGLSHYPIEHMPHGSAGMPDPGQVQDARIQEAQIQRAEIQDAPVRSA